MCTVMKVMVIVFYAGWIFFMHPTYINHLPQEHLFMNGHMHVRSLWRNVRARLALKVTLAVRVGVKLFGIHARVKRAERFCARTGSAWAGRASGARALANRGEYSLPLCFAPYEFQKPRHIIFLLLLFHGLNGCPWTVETRVSLSCSFKYFRWDGLFS